MLSAVPTHSRQLKYSVSKVVVQHDVTGHPYGGSSTRARFGTKKGNRLAEVEVGRPYYNSDARSGKSKEKVDDGKT